MAAAMVVPGILLLCLYWLGAHQRPGLWLYCALMIAAMIPIMVCRREEDSQDHRRHAKRSRTARRMSPRRRVDVCPMRILPRDRRRRGRGRRCVAGSLRD